MDRMKPPFSVDCIRQTLKDASHYSWGVKRSAISDNFLFIRSDETLTQYGKNYLHRFKAAMNVVKVVSLDSEGAPTSDNIPYRKGGAGQDQYPLIIIANWCLQVVVMQIRKPKEIHHEVKDIIQTQGVTFVGKGVKKDLSKLLTFEVQPRDPEFLDSSSMAGILYHDEKYVNLAGMEPKKSLSQTNHKTGLGFLSYVLTSFDHKPMKKEDYRKKYGQIQFRWPYYKTIWELYDWRHSLRPFQRAYTYWDGDVVIVALWEISILRFGEDIEAARNIGDLGQIFQKAVNCVLTEEVSPQVNSPAGPATVPGPDGFVHNAGDSDPDTEETRLKAAICSSRWDDSVEGRTGYHRRVFCRKNVPDDQVQLVPESYGDYDTFSPHDLARWKRDKSPNRNKARRQAYKRRNFFRERNRKRERSKKKRKSEDQSTTMTSSPKKRCVGEGYEPSKFFC